MLNNLYIYHHLGMGDHLVCNGLVRHIILISNFDRYFLFVKEFNYTSVKSMYSDILNLELIVVKSDLDVNKYLNRKEFNILQIGFQHMNLSQYKFDECFYKQLNVPFEYRWSKFKINRNKEKELEIFKKFNIEENNYVFLHDDLSRGYQINRDYIKNKEYKIVSPVIGYTNNMLDYSYIIENAKELHFMDSSFRLLFDSLHDKNQLSYYHTYIRGRGNENTSNSKKIYITL